MSPRSVDVATVKAAAQGRWPNILAALQINVPDSPKKYAPCPRCGGKDRFRFDDRDGHGSWFCNQCIPKSGDGFQLTKNALGLSFPEALKAVAGVLGLDPAHCSRPHQPLPSPPVRIDRWATAFRFELAGLDLRLRASRIQEAAKHLDLERLTDAELDHAMELVAGSYADLARAELFEQVADDLRLRDFFERKQSDASLTRST